jgi:hypothetical protein
LGNLGKGIHEWWRSMTRSSFESMRTKC